MCAFCRPVYSNIVWQQNKHSHIMLRVFFFLSVREWAKNANTLYKFSCIMMIRSFASHQRSSFLFSNTLILMHDGWQWYEGKNNIQYLRQIGLIPNETIIVFKVITVRACVCYVCICSRLCEAKKTSNWKNLCGWVSVNICPEKQHTNQTKYGWSSEQKSCC